MNFRFPLATTTWDQAEYDAIGRVVESGMFTMGPYVAQFEVDFAAYVGSRYAVMVNSGSSANLLMTAALTFTSNRVHRLNAGDEIIVPAVSWATTYYPLHQYGLIQRVVDIDLRTLNYDLDALEQAITPATRAIMVVNLLGNPNDFDRIRNLTAGRDIRIISKTTVNRWARDTRTRLRELSVSWAVSVRSFRTIFQRWKGGLVVTDDEELYHILLSLRAQRSPVIFPSTIWSLEQRVMIPSRSPFVSFCRVTTFERLRCRGDRHRTGEEAAGDDSQRAAKMVEARRSGWVIILRS